MPDPACSGIVMSNRNKAKARPCWYTSVLPDPTAKPSRKGWGAILTSHEPIINTVIGSFCFGMENTKAR